MANTVSNFFFENTDVISFRDRAPYNEVRRRIEINSITLKNYVIDKNTWAQLRGAVIANLNLCKCTISTWAGSGRVHMQVLWIEDCDGFADFARNVCSRSLDRLVLSRCNVEMASVLFPLLGQCTVRHIEINDVDALFLTHVSMKVPGRGRKKNGVQNELESFRLARTSTHISVVFAVSVLCKIACLMLREFEWSESGLGDAWAEVLEDPIIQSLAWNVDRMILHNNGLTIAVYERLEAFKNSISNLRHMDVSENSIPPNLVQQLFGPSMQDASSSSRETSEVSDDGDDDKESDGEDEKMEMDIVEDDDGGGGMTTHADNHEDEDDEDERKPKKRRVERENREPRSLSLRSSRGNTLEALTARYWRSGKPPIKIKKI